MFTTRTAFTVMLLCLFGCGGSADVTETWETEVASWKQSRVESLRDNWISLAGLHWLEEGTVTFGSDGSSDLVFPERLPERMGTISLQDDIVRMHVEPGVDIFHEGERVETIQLVDDSQAEPTVVSISNVDWHAIERDGRYAIRVYDRERAAGLTVDDLPFYPLDPRWRVQGKFEAYDPVRTVPVPNVMGTLSELASPGRIAFEVDGETYHLDVLEGSATRYFVMFADATNRTDTYEAGRYVYIDHEDERGEVVIDFNQSYNPPCAFTPYATCPFPPPQNRLPIEIAAGEKRVDDDRWSGSRDNRVTVRGG